ncbi:MAG: carboxyl transferase domain-containing protein [Actinomycetes bacterium]
MADATGSRIEIRSPMVGTVAALPAALGATLGADSVVALVESMKMEHPVTAPEPMEITEVVASVGDAVAKGDLLVVGRVVSMVADVEAEATAEAPDRLAELLAREATLADAARPERVAKRHVLGLRTARENVADLVDEGSLVEYGRFAYAAQRARRSEAELIAETPADGLIGGIATVNAERFGPEASSCVVVSYDYMVLAGTQGQRNHAKKDRLFELAERLGLPVVLFAEGGGGRPGDTDTAVVTGLDTGAFALFARLSGQVPLIGIAAGRCFAGNAALLGCCDIVIAVEGASIGMGGPAMIEGGGLGVVAPDEVGPVAVHAAAGSVDLVVRDEAEAVDVARRLLGLFQGAEPGVAPDTQALRAVVPAERKRAFDPRAAIEGIVDVGTLIELRPDFAPNLVTGLARIDGRTVAILANDSRTLAGAIDAPAADKAARHLQMAEARGIPVISLIDTPGFMVGPEAEATGLVRHVSRMFVAAGALSVPVVAIVLRRAYGLGAQAMAAGSLRIPLATVAWPSGELGGMGLEGAVRLGFRRELEAIEDPVARQEAEAAMIAAAYEHGRALNVAAHLEIDDVIDPAQTRALIIRLLAAAPARLGEPRRRFIDTF